MINPIDLPISPKILAVVSKLDRFEGEWSAGPLIPAERLPRLEEAARIQSTAASSRLAGLRVTDAEVAGLLRGEAVPLPDSAEVLGYAGALAAAPLPPDRLFSSDDLRLMHAAMMGARADSPSSPWRVDELHREEFDAEGHATGRVFSTLPPRLVEEKTEELLTWLEYELRSADHHPVLVIGAFLIYFSSTSPFARGNARLKRLLATRLLLRAGYGSIVYSSIERRIEERREEYYEAMHVSQARIWTTDADIGPWLEFFLDVLEAHRERMLTKMAVERKATDYPPLQRAILETVREHGSVDAALLIRATGANRNTLKDNLRRLVQHGVLRKTGERRGTRYSMSSGVARREDAPDA